MSHSGHGSAYQRVTEALEARSGRKPRGPADRKSAICPAHEDRQASLSVRRGEARALLYCHAGCDTRDVVAALDMTMADLFDAPRTVQPRKAGSPQTIEYPYVDERGEVLYVVQRGPGKKFRQRRPGPGGTWLWNLDGARRVLYRLPEVVTAVEEKQRVYVVEGEKDVETARAAGLVATCNSGGAGKWLSEYSDVLLGADVVVVADRDLAGYRHAQAVSGSLQKTARSVHVVHAAAGKDLSDHLKDGYTVKDLVELTLEDLAVAASGSPASSSRSWGWDHKPDPSPQEPLTDYGNARRLREAYGHQIRYVPAWGKWFIWDGRRWASDATGQVQRCAKQVGRSITEHARTLNDSREVGKWMSAGRRAESAAGVAGMLTLLGTELDIATRPEDFDAEPWLLNCTNGVLDLRTTQLRPHDPALLLTKLTNACYRPDAARPEFDAFLSYIQPDLEVRNFLARLFGQALIGEVIEHLLPILLGSGANGKTTLIEILMAALGDYAITAEPALLLESTVDRHPTEKADLFGCRLAVVPETDAGRSLAEATVKQLTGGDRIKARRMREDPWQFKPSHTLVMVTNHRPRVRGQNEGLWRRLLLVHFPVIVPVRRRDRHLREKLLRELDGVLLWMVTGLVTWQQGGLLLPDAVTAATSEFRGDSDQVSRFINDQCRMGPTAQVGSSDLLTAFERWCEQEGEATLGSKTFSQAVAARLGHGTDRIASGKVWRGLALRECLEDRHE